MKKIRLLFVALISCSSIWGADITWASASTLSAPLVDSSDPKIVMDVNGNTTVAWVESGYIKSSARPVGGSWGSVATVSGASSSSPRLGVNSSGTVTAVWVESGVIKSATLALGGAWSAATSLSSSGASSPVLSVNANGDTAAVWVRGGFIEAKTRASGGSWSLTVSSLSGANADNPDVSVGSNGTILAVWHIVVGGSNILQSSQQIIGGVWSAATNIIAASTAFSHNFPKVAVDQTGVANVIWYRYLLQGSIYTNVQVITTLYSNGSWGALPTVLSGTGVANLSLVRSKITVDSSGNYAAIWGMSYDYSSYSIETATKKSGSTWNAITLLAALDNHAYQADVAMNSLGDGVFVFMSSMGSNVPVYASESQLSGPFPDFFANNISLSSVNNNSRPRVATAYSSGTIYAAAVWLGYDGANDVVQVATGSRSSLAPPTDLSVLQTEGDFGVFQDYYNTVSWTASVSPNIMSYAVYRNGMLYTVTDASTYSVEDHNEPQNGAVIYGVAAIDTDRAQSETITISFP